MNLFIMRFLYYMEDTLNRVYSLRDIKIAPVELSGLKARADLQNADQDTPLSAIVSIPQLYELSRPASIKPAFSKAPLPPRPLH